MQYQTLSRAASLPYMKTVRYSYLTFAKNLLVTITHLRPSIHNNHWQCRGVHAVRPELRGRKFASSAYNRLTKSAIMCIIASLAYHMFLMLVSSIAFRFTVYLWGHLFLSICKNVIYHSYSSLFQKTPLHQNVRIVIIFYCRWPL